MPTTSDNISKRHESTDGTVLSSKTPAGQVRVNETIPGVAPQHTVHAIQPRRPSDVRAEIEAKNIGTQHGQWNTSTVDLAKTPPVVKLDDNDLGFTFADAPEEIVSSTDLSKMEGKYNLAKRNLNEVVTLFTNFLAKFAEHPEQDYIKWPKRTDAIRSMMERINALKEQA